MPEKVFFFAVLFFLLWPSLQRGQVAEAVNPYLPLWEHIPDGEPRLFEDPDHPGKFRVYLYGSHDTRRTAYCGFEIPVWSAPVEDLNDWSYHGIGFQSIVNGEADILFAPDVVEVVQEDGCKLYYLYPNNQAPGRNSQVAKAARPDGPFEVINWKRAIKTETTGIMGFDPAVFVDDDGRVYGYWGFKRLFAAELNPQTMYSIQPGTPLIHDLIGSCEQGDDNIFRYFEAPSLRKVEDQYVLIYSRMTKRGEYGLGESNATLAYAYSPAPLGPWTYGGTIVDARGPELGKNGEMIASQPWHNTHGSILKVGDQWYIFYHRSTNNDGYARQAMVEAIEVEVTAEGRVEIRGKRPVEDRLGNIYKGAEITSQGFELEGLDPFRYYSAGITSYLLGGPYVKATYDPKKDHAPVVNIRNNAVVGYKYFNFYPDKGGNKNIHLEIELEGAGVPGILEVWLDSPWEKQKGIKMGEVELPAQLGEGNTRLVLPTAQLDFAEGKHAVFFVFRSASSGVICTLHGFKFERLGESSDEPAFQD